MTAQSIPRSHLGVAPSLLYALMCLFGLTSLLGYVLVSLSTVDAVGHDPFLKMLSVEMSIAALGLGLVIGPFVLLVTRRAPRSHAIAGWAVIALGALLLVTAAGIMSIATNVW